MLSLRWLALASVLLLSACAKTTVATDDDKTRAHARCAKDTEYQASESADAEKTFADHCAKNACPGKDYVAALCVYRDPGGGPIAEVESTIAKGDSENEQAVCHSVRAASAVARFVPLDVYCKDGKRCMACGTE